MEHLRTFDVNVVTLVVADVSGFWEELGPQFEKGVFEGLRIASNGRVGFCDFTKQKKAQAAFRAFMCSRPDLFKGYCMVQSVMCGNPKELERTLMSLKS